MGTVELTLLHSERPKELELIVWEIFYLQKHFGKTFEGEMLITSQTTTLLQMFCELTLYSQVIFKSLRVADDTLKRNSDC